MEKIYFDNGSTSWPKAPGVAEAMANLLTAGAFNINRGNYEGAYEVESIVLETRDMLARLFHAPDSRHIIFTPGITHSLNYFIKGFLKNGDHVIVTGLEHNAVMRPLHQMEAHGVTYDIAKTDEEGTVKPEDVESLIKDSTKAVIVTHASNVCGTVVPIKEIGMICKKHNLFFAVDSAQSAGTLEIDMQGWGIDFLAFTGHKGLLGPQGIGGFAISPELDEVMTPYIAGGTGSVSDSLDMPTSLPDKYESGTMNLPGIIGLREGLLWLKETGIDKIRAHEQELTTRFLEGVRPLEEAGDIRIVGKKYDLNRTGVVSIQTLKKELSEAAYELDANYGIMTRVGLHCAPSAHKTLGTYPTGTIRFSFGWWNTEEHVDAALKALEEICHGI